MTRDLRVGFALAAVALGGCYLRLDEGELTGGSDAAAAVTDASVPDDSAAAGPDLSLRIDFAGAAPDFTGTVADLAASPDLTAPPLDLALPGCTSLFCEEFENGINGWTVRTMNAIVGTDGVHKNRGLKALHVAVGAAPQNVQAIGELEQNQALQTAPTEIYLRAYFYLPSPAPSAHFRVMATFQSANPYAGVGLFIDGGKLTISNDIASTYHVSTTALPLDRWACVELHVHESNVNGSISVKLDGAPVADLGLAESTRPATAINIASLGASVYDATQAATLPFDLWVDSVIIDQQPIGCAK